MSIKSTRGILMKASRDLNASWAQTRMQWTDGKAREFEERYLRPLPEALNSASTIIEELDRVLANIRRDCE